MLATCLRVQIAVDAEIHKEFEKFRSVELEINELEYLGFILIRGLIC